MTINDLTTLDNVKSWLGLTTTTDDALLTRLISASSGFIQSILNRMLASQAYTEIRDGKGTRSLSLANYPVTAVATLTIDGITIPPAPAVNQAGYVFSSGQIMLYGYCFTRGFQNIAISYTAGYSTIPYEIEQACIELCVLRYKERDRIGQVSKSIAGEVVSFTQKDMPADVMTLLQQYKRVITV